MSKRAVRENYITKRAGFKFVSGEMSKAICKNLIEFLEKELPDKKIISTYISMGSEVDTREFISSKNKDYDLCFPYTDDKNNIIMYRADKFTDITVDRKGNQICGKYAQNTQKTSVVPDIVLVPMIAFNKSLHRVGYGLGCYDKYFSSNNNCIKIGLAYDEQEADFTVNDLDVSLDYIVTQSTILKR